MLTDDKKDGGYFHWYIWKVNALVAYIVTYMPILLGQLKIIFSSIFALLK